MPAKKFGVLRRITVVAGPALWKQSSRRYHVPCAILLMATSRRRYVCSPARASGRRGKMTLAQECQGSSAEEIPQGQEHRAFYLLSAPKKITAAKPLRSEPAICRYSALWTMVACARCVSARLLLVSATIQTRRSPRTRPVRPNTVLRGTNADETFAQFSGVVPPRG